MVSDRWNTLRVSGAYLFEGIIGFGLLNGQAAYTVYYGLNDAWAPPACNTSILHVY